MSHKKDAKLKWAKWLKHLWDHIKIAIGDVLATAKLIIASDQVLKIKKSNVQPN